MRELIPGCANWTSETFVRWCKKARDAVHHKMIVQGKTIGGLGSLVEIDEAAFGRAKLAANQHMHPAKPIWLLGNLIGKLYLERHIRPNRFLRHIFRCTIFFRS